MDREKLISEFRKVTDVDETRAQWFLEASGWNIQLAIASFFEDDDDASSDEVVEETPPATAKPAPLPPPPPQKVGSSREKEKIVTINSLLQNEENSDEEGQAFYAGGSTRSGQQVLGPAKQKYRHIVEEMFKAAKSHGAEVIDQSDTQCSSTQLRAFRGTGHVLGGTAENTCAEGDNRSSSSQCLTVCLRAWRTGFTVANGPFRDYVDPQNKEFLDSIKKGEIPHELIHLAKGGEVSVNIEDHSHEDYTPPRQSLTVFSGQGHRLGSPTPHIIGSGMGDSQMGNNETEAINSLSTDLSQPITTVQVRLADGSRLILKLNHTHTIGNIRQYIVTARPEYSATVFSLMISYPPAELSDDNVTVIEANLLNSVIVQKLL